MTVHTNQPGRVQAAAPPSGRTRIDHVAVIVPAADEEARIGDCLHALRQAVAHLHAEALTPVTSEVVVVLDRCRDRTAAVVSAFPEVRTILTDTRNVGTARALGTAAALAGQPRLEQMWTAHTDADSTVPPHWLTTQLALADDGVDVVLGTVKPGSELAPATRLAWHRLHLDADDHPHIHGANLGIRASSYTQLGGWQACSSGEDVDLAHRATDHGARISRPGSITVHTSARLDGRTPHGFSHYLRQLANETRDLEENTEAV